MYAERVQLNGKSTIAGFPTPTDTAIPPGNPGQPCPQDDCQLLPGAEFDVSLENDTPPPSGSSSYAYMDSALDLVETGPVDYAGVRPAVH